FYPLAFLGTWETATVVKVLFTNYVLKVGWEALATPLTYRIVGFLKRAEYEDWFDRDTGFTPFSLSVESLCYACAWQPKARAAASSSANANERRSGHTRARDGYC